MKKLTLILIAMWPALWVSAQQNPIPDVDLRDLDGKLISSTEITQPGTTTLVVFWKLSGSKCCENLDLLEEAWLDLLSPQGVRMVAICVDCNGSWTQVKPVVNGNNWEFETYIDVNGDFSRAMCVGDVPCTMLIDEDRGMVCRYNSVCTGDQDFICNNILDHLAGSVTAANYDAE